MNCHGHRRSTTEPGANRTSRSPAPTRRPEPGARAERDCGKQEASPAMEYPSRVTKQTPAPALQGSPSTHKAPAVTLFSPPLIAESVVRDAFFASDDTRSVASGTKSVGGGAFSTRGPPGKRRAWRFFRQRRHGTRRQRRRKCRQQHKKCRQRRFMRQQRRAKRHPRAALVVSHRSPGNVAARTREDMHLNRLPRRAVRVGSGRGGGLADASSEAFCQSFSLESFGHEVDECPSLCW
jgi:hypothetical protein